MRKPEIDDNPLCSVCKSIGKATPATCIVDLDINGKFTNGPFCFAHWKELYGQAFKWARAE